MSATPLSPVAEVAVPVAASAPVESELGAIPLATLGTYDAGDLAQIEALGLTAESEGVVWNETGNLIELTLSDPLIETISLMHAHSLEKLDLTGCESLTTLDCSSDWNLRELTLSGCVSLTEIDCFDDGELRALDLSDCPYLERLYCGETGIESLDLSNCHNLRALFLNDSPIEEVNIYGCDYFERISFNETLERLYMRPGLEITFESSTFFPPLSMEVRAENGDLIWSGSPSARHPLSVGAGERLTATHFKYEEILGQTEILGAYNPWDVQALERLGVSASDADNLVWDERGALVELTLADPALTELDLQNLAPDDWWESQAEEEAPTVPHFQSLKKLDVSGCANLRYLYCGPYFEALETIGVAGLSNLEILSCDQTSVASLDLTGCSSLRALYCSFCVSLTELDASDLGNLVYLSCDSTGLTELDLTPCPKLQELNCGNNAITRLNLANCAELRSLICQYVALSELDLSGLGALTSLDCRGNRITTLDLSPCPNLRVANLYYNSSLASLNLSNSLALRSLDCGADSALTSLDLSACSSLVSLYLAGAGIQELDVSRCAPNLELAVDYTLQNLTIGTDAPFNFRARKNIFRWDALRAIDANGNELAVGNEIRDWTHYERLIPITVPVEASDPIAVSYFYNNRLLGETTITRARTLDAPGLSASATKTAMVVKISPVAGATNYVLEYSPNSDFSNAKTKTYASSGVKTISGLEFGSTLYVRVKATADSRDDSPWTETIVTVGAVATPVLREVGAASASVSLSISNVDKAIGYAIEYSTSEDFANSTIVNYPSYGTKTISGLEPSSVYYFRAIARGDGANRVDSLWSAALSVETEAPLLELDAPQIAGSVTKSAMVVKINPVEGATSYVLEYGESADFSDATRRTYKTTGAKTISNLEFGSIYCVRVKAVGTPGVESDWSRIVLAVGGLAQPTLTVASASDVSVDVSFAKVANAAGYVVESSKLGDFSDAVAVQFPSSGTKTISGLDPSSTYSFRVKALGDATRADSPWSEPVFQETLAPLSQLAAPAILGSSTTKSAIVVKFAGVADATKYVLEFSTDPTFATKTTKSYASVGAKTISGLPSGETYYLRLKATGTGFADSAWVELTATTKGEPVSSAVLDAASALDEIFDDELEGF